MQLRNILHINKVSEIVLTINIIVTIIYLTWWLDFSHVGNIYLYALLFAGELYHIVMSLTFWHTIYPRRKTPVVKYNGEFIPRVDIFITVAGESKDIIQSTVRAAKNIDYPDKQIYILNDGYVARKQNWQAADEVAIEEGVYCITRTKAGGAKAGNINNALRKTNGELVVIFDADMIPEPTFLKKVTPYFQKKNLAFVQTPQYYKNHNDNEITSGAWDQQEFFFGPIMNGKNNTNAAFICGTNVAIRRKALDEVGGLAEDNIAEDFLTSLFIHEKKWKSVYLTEVLSQGLAPQDMLSYYNQQFRWARGSLEILFRHNPLFKSNLTWHQRLEYLSSALYYFNGIIFLMDILMPVIFLYFRLQPVSASTTSFAFFFIPFLALNLISLSLASAGTFSFKAISFSMSSWTLQIMAIFAALVNKKASFKVTSKKALHGNFIHIVYPHLIYIVIALGGVLISLIREGPSPAVITNTAWILFNIALFTPFIKASLPVSKTAALPKKEHIELGTVVLSE